MKREILYPVDTANFRWIRENGFLYVDKTGFIPRMTRTAKYYFLARPRRFGKSLFLDTLAEYFKGNSQLFQGLEISGLQPIPWTSYPVMRLNLSGYAYSGKNDLETTLSSAVASLENELDVAPSQGSVYDRFYQLIQKTYKRYGKGVVILIDEYDSPLSSVIDNKELQDLFRNQLQGFYANLKKAEEYIHFCMLTGVTRYGKVSVFSGLNNLKDISFSDEYAGICGITDEELHRYYADGVEALARREGIPVEEAYQLLRCHYDGYHFSSGMLDIYNPFSINKALSEGAVSDYWCQSGVPTVLSKSLIQNDFDVEKINGIKVSESDLSDLSMFDSNPIPLLYQTGYLTIKEYEPRRKRYTLGYPNREVEAGILNNILKVYTHSGTDRQGSIYDIEDSLEEGNPEEFLKILNSFFADIPHQLHRYVDRYENYYHTIFYCLASLIGLDVEAEYSTSEGFIDMVVKTSRYIYVIELKLNGTAEDAMKQIEEKHYSAPFEGDTRRLIKIGIGFSAKTHTISSTLIS